MKKIRQVKYITDGGKFRFFTNEKKRHILLPLIIALVCIVIVGIFIGVGFRAGTKLKVTHVSVAHEQVPTTFDGFRILQITDFFGKEYGDRQAELKKLIADEEYDIVVLGGDYFGKTAGDEDFWYLKDLFECFKKDVPVYYILGDTDYEPIVHSTKSDKWKMCLIPPEKTLLQTYLEETCGATFVYPAQKITNDAGDSIYLTGILNDKEIMNRMDFDPDVDFSITITHKPINYDVTRHLKDVNKYTITEIDYDLSISGHTGGGQFRIPIFGAVYDPEEGWFPQEDDLVGLSKDGSGRYNYISAGLGVEKGVRFYSNPEVSIIELKTKVSEK